MLADTLLALLFELDVAVDFYEELPCMLDGHASLTLVSYQYNSSHSSQLVLAQVIDVKIGQVGPHGKDWACLCNLKADSIKIIVGFQRMEGAHHISGLGG